MFPPLRSDAAAHWRSRYAVPADPVDWSLAERVGRTVAGSGPATTPRQRARVRRDFAELTIGSDELVRSFTGLEPAEPIGEPEVVGRPGWIGANASGFRSLLEPIADRMGSSVGGGRISRRITGAALGVQIGVLLGYLSQKVLGQYDLVLASESGGRLYFVGPNVIEMERRFDLVPRDFRQWIALHEVTHRTQFAAVPWLRARVRALVDRALGAIELDPERVRRLVERGRDLLLGGPRAWRHADIMTMFLSDEQREVVGEMQALMTVVEGHGTFVMNRIGAEQIRSFDRLERMLHERRRGARGTERAFQRAIGLDMKYEQYSLGERFMNEVADRAGIGALGRMWDGEGSMPTLDDLRDPDGWLRRVGA